MKLAAWLEREGLTYEQFGERINKSGPSVGRYATGKRFPDADVQAEIFRATNGEVEPNDFVALPSLEPDTPQSIAPTADADAAARSEGVLQKSSNE